MSDDTFPWAEPAVLIWLFPGDNLDEADFDWAWVESPPDENPQDWDTFREAVTYASTVDCAHGKGAWIKVGDRIFNPVNVFNAHRLLGA